MADAFFTRAPSTIVTIPLTGQLEFTIPFEFLARKFVVVTLLGTDRKVLTLGTDYRFIAVNKIQLARQPDGDYTRIELRRYTSATDRLVAFIDGSILRANDLNLAQVQTMHVAEEARDMTSDNIGVNDDGELDARNRKIVNLADGENPLDAVNLGQLRQFDTSTGSNADRAERSALAAKVSETNAANSEVRCVSAEAKSISSAGTAMTAASDANRSKVSAQTSSESASAAKDAALMSEQKAKEQADRAEMEADKLSNYVNFPENLAKGDGFNLIGTISIEDLRSYTGSANKLICHGYSSGEVDYSVFVRDASDTTSPDDGGTIIVSTSGIRWKRAFHGPKYVKYYGANTKGVDNTQQLQKAINSGGKVCVDGSYSFNGTLKVDYSDLSFPEITATSKRVDLVGNTRGNSILSYGGTGRALDIKGMGTTLSHGLLGWDRTGDMTLTTVGKTKNGIGLYMESKAYFEISNMAFEYFNTGLLMRGCLTGDVRNVIAEYNKVGLDIARSNYSLVNAVTFRGLRSKQNTQVGIIGELGGGNEFSGCTFEANGTRGLSNSGGVIMNLDGSNGAASFTMTSCYFEGNAGAADLYLNNISSDHVTVVLTGCLFNRIGATNYTDNNIVITSSGSGGITLVTNGCTFSSSGGYTPSPNRPFVLTGSGCEWIDNGSTFSEVISLGTTGPSYPTSSSRVLSGNVSAAGVLLSGPIGVDVQRKDVGYYRLVASGKPFGSLPNSYTASAHPNIGYHGGSITVSVQPISTTEVDIFMTTAGGGPIDVQFSWQINKLC